jgi:hypothetical protein
MVVAVMADDDGHRHHRSLPPPAKNGGDTSMTKSLNSQIAEGDNGVFTGGKGILVRTPDFFTGGGTVVAPATFWVNDIKTPSQAYPAGNPWCPHGQSDGFYDISWETCDVASGPWDYATVSAVIGMDGMDKLFPEFDKIQDATWGWGVFYATDSNSADKRCRYLASDNGWDCPGYWLGEDGSVTQDSNKHGAGYYNPGNPYAGKGGGGAGCHFDTNSALIDQTDASGDNNLVQDYDCQCNYFFSDDWSDWVDTWVWKTKSKAGFPSRDWLAQGGGKAPAWAVDVAMCWVNNPRDMINMQNALWYHSDDWLNYKAPYASATNSPHYWGWNEVPVSKDIVDDPTNWDAVMIKLPARVYSINDLSSQAQSQLEQQLDKWETKGTIIPGSDKCALRPGSYMVVVSETDDDTANLFTRWFFCENWTSPNNYYMLVFYAQGGGACFIDKPQFSIAV